MSHVEASVLFFCEASHHKAPQLRWKKTTGGVHGITRCKAGAGLPRWKALSLNAAPAWISHCVCTLGIHNEPAQTSYCITTAAELTALRLTRQRARPRAPPRGSAESRPRAAPRGRGARGGGFPRPPSDSPRAPMSSIAQLARLQVRLSHLLHVFHPARMAWSIEKMAVRSQTPEHHHRQLASSARACPSWRGPPRAGRAAHRWPTVRIMPVDHREADDHWSYGELLEGAEERLTSVVQTAGG